MSNKDFDNLEERSAEVKGVEKPKPAKDYLDEYYKTLGNGTLEYLGIKTGLGKLDKATLGLDGLIVLGAISGGGKTTLALQLAFDACELGTPTIFYSLEMPKRAIFTKILNRLAEVRYSDILLKGRRYLDGSKETNILGEEIDRYKHLSKAEAEKLKEAKAKLADISDRFYLRSRESKEAVITFDSVEREINLIKAEHKADKVLVVIDHLQVFNAGDYKDQIDKEGKLITNFKGISERTGATILLISQKNKAGFNKTGGNLGDIKGSVDIVYLADLVMFIEGEDEKQDGNEADIDDIIANYGGAVVEKVKLVIAKNRYNAQTKIKLDFNKEYSKFSERIE